MLAMLIDDAFVNWLLAGAAVVVPTIVTTVVMLWRKLIAFLKPMIVDAFSSHTKLVNTLDEQVPLVTSTLQKLQENQNIYRERLNEHGQTLNDHGEKLDKILTIVKGPST